MVNRISKKKAGVANATILYGNSHSLHDIGATAHQLWLPKIEDIEYQ
jgi:hypothetical protein